MRYAYTAAGIALSLLAFRGTAQAEPIQYTERATASGTLGSESFTNRQIVVSYTGDTANVSSPAPGVLQNSGGVAAFYLRGVGAGTFKGGIALLIKLQSGFSIAAISTNPNLVPNAPGGNSAGGDVLGTNNPALASYNLATPLGPLVGPSVLQSNPAAGSNGVPGTFSTTAGNLTLTSAGNVRFLATTYAEGKGNGGDNGDGEGDATSN